jgi:hypothetical protein
MWPHAARESSASGKTLSCLKKNQRSTVKIKKPEFSFFIIRFSVFLPPLKGGTIH